MFHITPLRVIVSMCVCVCVCVCVCTRMLCTVYIETLNAPLPKFSRQGQYIFASGNTSECGEGLTVDSISNTHTVTFNHILTAQICPITVSLSSTEAQRTTAILGWRRDVVFNNAKLSILYRMLQF